MQLMCGKFYGFFVIPFFGLDKKSNFFDISRGDSSVSITSNEVTSGSL